MNRKETLFDDLPACSPLTGCATWGQNDLRLSTQQRFLLVHCHFAGHHYTSIYTVGDPGVRKKRSTASWLEPNITGTHVPFTRTLWRMAVRAMLHMLLNVINFNKNKCPSACFWTAFCEDIENTSYSSTLKSLGKALSHLLELGRHQGIS